MTPFEPSPEIITLKQAGDFRLVSDPKHLDFAVLHGGTPIAQGSLRLMERIFAKRTSNV